MGYTLRKITGKGAEFNFSLGNGYTVVHNLKSPEAFKQCFESYFKLDYPLPARTELVKPDYVPSMEEVTFAFVSSDGGERILPLFYEQENYIMTDDGKTFSKINP